MTTGRLAAKGSAVFMSNNAVQRPARSRCSPAAADRERCTRSACRSGATGRQSEAVRTADDLDARGRRLRAALAAVLVRDNAPELRLMREWLDSWLGIGLIVAGMARQGFDLQLTRHDECGWSATFGGRGRSHQGGPFQ
jgi:hypothetical protein